MAYSVAAKSGHGQQCLVAEAGPGLVDNSKDNSLRDEIVPCLSSQLQRHCREVTRCPVHTPRALSIMLTLVMLGIGGSWNGDRFLAKRRNRK
jgi:hypothetical protein